MEHPSPENLEEILRNLDRKQIIDLLRTADRVLEKVEVKKWESYVPHEMGLDGGQKAFHAAAKTHKIRLLITGNRFGKTTCSIKEIEMLATGTHPHLKIPIPNRGKLYGDSYSMVMENIYLKFKEWVNPALLDQRKPFEFNNQGLLTGINWRCGSITKIGSYDQETRKAEGSNWHYCIAKGERVLMGDGSWKNIENIKVGDSLPCLAKNRRRMKSRVNGVRHSGKKEIFNLSVVGGHEIKTSADHKFFAKNGQWIALKDLKIGDKIYFPEASGYGEENAICPDMAFLVGAWIGDGWSDQKRIFIAGEDEFINHLSDRFASHFTFKHRKKYDYEIRSRYSNNDLRFILKREGLFGKKAFEKFVPDFIFRQNEKIRCEFLAGLFSTDGWISNEVIGYASTSPQLANDVVKLLSSVGVYSGIYNKKKQDEKWRDQKFVMICKAKQVEKFHSKIFLPIKNKKLKNACLRIQSMRNEKADLALRRFKKTPSQKTKIKNQIANERNTFQWRTIKSIQSFGFEDTFDISVEKYQNFICEGFLVHNCAYDEPPSRDLYVANMRGLVDFGGITWIAATPLSEPWIFDDLWMPGLQGQKPYIKCFRGTSDDNPHIDKAQLSLFLEELTEEEKNIRFYGHFARLSGLVINTYDPQLSDIDWFQIDDNFCLYEGIDPHSKKPHAVLWKAINREGFRFVVDELSFDGKMEDFALEIIEKRKELTAHGAVLVKSVIDSAINQEDLAFKANQYNELKKFLRQNGETVLPAIAAKGRGSLLSTIQILKDLYRPVRIDKTTVEDEATFNEKHLYDIESQNFDKEIPTVKKLSDILRPMQYIFPNCVKYKKELLHYQWPKDPSSDDMKPIDKNNEYISCDRYIEQMAPKFQTPGSCFIKTLPQGYNQRNYGKRERRY